MNSKQATSFEEVVEKYSSFVYNVALRIVGDPADAEDVTQEAFIDAFRAWERFRGESQVSTWLYRIAVNRSLMKLRKEKKGRQLTDTGLEDQQVDKWTEGPEKAALSSELRDKLQEGLGLLPPDLRAAVVMRDVQGLTNVEAAVTLGISIAALKARLHRGRLLLRKYLDEYIHSSGRG